MTLEKRLEKARQELLHYANRSPEDPVSAYDIIHEIGKSRHGGQAFGAIGVRYAREYFDIAQAALVELNTFIESN